VDSSGNVARKPARIILVRHAESTGNVDESAYVTTPDWRIPLTAKGMDQATEAGKKLREIVKGGELFFYYSPYKRTRQTMECMKSAFEESELIGEREEPRIAEQQFGNFQDTEAIRKAKNERRRFGRFFYRFPQGEAGLDVYNRVSSFISTIYRDIRARHEFEVRHNANGIQTKSELANLNIVIVTHGITLRLLLMRWFQVRVGDWISSSLLFPPLPSSCSSPPPPLVPPLI
jgi:broad specificity phosphatase PhoE